MLKICILKIKKHKICDTFDSARARNVLHVRSFLFVLPKTLKHKVFVKAKAKKKMNLTALNRGFQFSRVILSLESIEESNAHIKTHLITTSE